jgi:hypothetical protein
MTSLYPSPPPPGLNKLARSEDVQQALKTKKNKAGIKKERNRRKRRVKAIALMILKLKRCMPVHLMKLTVNTCILVSTR